MGALGKFKGISDRLEYASGVKIQPIEKIPMMADYLWEHFVHGVELIEYDQYRFYWKSRKERRRFVCIPQFNAIIKAMNNETDYKYFDSKPLFNKTFAKFMGRNWVDANICSYDEFLDLYKANDSLFVKPAEGMCGRGAYLMKTDDGDTEAVFDRLKKEGAIVEQVVRQHADIAAFNASSVNTMRVVTMLLPDGDVKVMAAVLRLGRAGEVVDNFHNYGVVALIDVESGVVMTTGVDRDFKRYVLHPDSKLAIPGFRIPSWDKVVETVKEAAKVVPSVGYVGWDVAIGEDGQVVMIEGNKSADHDVTQVTDQVGKWPMYKEILDAYKRKEKSK